MPAPLVSPGWTLTSSKRFTVISGGTTDHVVQKVWLGHLIETCWENMVRTTWSISSAHSWGHRERGEKGTASALSHAIGSAACRFSISAVSAANPVLSSNIPEPEEWHFCIQVGGIILFFWVWFMEKEPCSALGEGAQTLMWPLHKGTRRSPNLKGHISGAGKMRERETWKDTLLNIVVAKLQLLVRELGRECVREGWERKSSASSFVNMLLPQGWYWLRALVELAVWTKQGQVPIQSLLILISDPKWLTNAGNGFKMQQIFW